MTFPSLRAALSLLNHPMLYCVRSESQSDPTLKAGILLSLIIL